MAGDDRNFVLLFIALTLCHVAVLLLSPLDLSGDELHYALWAKNLDYCYYSKGPLVALLIAASTAVFGETAFAIRIPALLCVGLFSLLFYLFLRREYGTRIALGLWIALRSALIFAQSGLVMTTDAPLALLWFIALWAGFEAVVRGRSHYLLLFGIAVGLAIWSKYTALFLFPSLLLAILVCSAGREVLRKPSFYLGLSLCAVFLLPIVYWNANYGWANFAHNAGHLVKGSGIALRPKYFIELFFSQVALVGPLLFCGVLYVGWLSLRYFKELPTSARYFLSFALPLAVFVVLVAMTKRVYANWPLPIYIAGLLLLGDFLSRRDTELLKFRHFFRPAIVFNLVLLFAAHLPLTGATFGIPGSVLPTKKLVAWSELGQAVQGLSERRTLDGFATPQVIITDKYWTASAIPFYAEAPSRILLSNLSDRRMTQFDIWQRDADWQELEGDDALLILNDAERVEKLREHFGRIEADSEQPVLEIVYGGEVVRRFYFFHAFGYDGWIPPQPRK